MKPSKKGGSGPPICRGRRDGIPQKPRFWARVFKFHLLLIMWPIFVEFVQRAWKVRGEKRRQKKEDRRIQVKPKSTDKYVGRPKYALIKGSRHGFVRNRSTLTNLLVFMEEVTNRHKVMTHWKLFFRKPLSKATFERKLSSVSWPKNVKTLSCTLKT